MKTKLQQRAENVLTGTIDKLAQSELIYKELYKKRDPEKMRKFVALNLLDYYLSVISPSQLAEYQQLRYKK